MHQLVLALLLTLSAFAGPEDHAPLVGKKVAAPEEVTRHFPGFATQGIIGDKGSDGWPATIHSIKECKDSAVFEVKGYGRHEYPSKDYTGKTFRIILLDTPGGKQTAIILVR